MITDEQMRLEITKAAEKAGSQVALIEQMKKGKVTVSTGTLSLILKGGMPVPKKVARYFGYSVKRTIEYQFEPIGKK